MHTEYTLLIFVAIASIFFSYVYWRDSTDEGFGSDKIFDSIFLMGITALLGGKLLFRELSIDYFRYQFINTPLLLEGVLVGGGVGLFLTVKHNKWSGWKIGDMIAPALASFQGILFLGFWIIYKETYYLIVFLLFSVLYMFIRYLKYNKQLGSSSQFFQMKRLKRLTFTGVVLTIYLTCSSLIAILFLLFNRKLDSKFWWFQIIFYLSAFLITIGFFIRRAHKEELRIMNIKKVSFPNIDFIKSKLHRLKKEEGVMNKKDPFIQEYKDEGFRNLDELGDEAAELSEHKAVKAVWKRVNTEFAVNAEKKSKKEDLRLIRLLNIV